MLVLSLLISIVLAFIAYVVWAHCALVKQSENIPGPKQHFLIGNALTILLDPVSLFKLGREYAITYDGLYKWMTLNLIVINVYNAKDVETVMSSSKNNAKGFVYKFLRPWLGDGLLLSKGTKWQARRKILTPTFHFNILSEFNVILGKLTQSFVDGLEEKLDQPLDISPIISQYTLAATCETAMGTSLPEDNPVWKKYKRAIIELTAALYHRFCKFPFYFDAIYRMSPMWYTQKRALEDLHDFTSNVIHDRKQSKRNTKNHSDINIRRNKHTPMLDLLLAAQNEGLIDDAGIQEEVDTFMFEGHDTTASALIFCLMSLANEPIVQENIFLELKTIFGDSERLADMKDLSNMKYMECCIKESLRLYPPVYFMSRITGEDLVLSGHKVSAGTEISIHVFDLHRREDQFPDPERFDPNRFLPENCVNRHPYAYIPFSAGPRNCIGQKFAMLLMKSVLSGILRRYKLLPVTTHADIVPFAELVLRNSTPVKVKFSKRMLV